MSKREAIVVAFIALIFQVVSQDSTAVQPNPNWKLKSIIGLNITQSTFTNWAAGGRNNLSGLGFVNAQAEYSKDKLKWLNTMSLGLGGIQYFDEGIQKTEDVIDLQSTFSYGIKSPWFFSILGGFRTQFIDGFANIADTIRSSTFMAPGYVNISIGMEYVPIRKLRIMASPLSGKFTFVQDQRLANLGAFGVTPAVLDGTGQISTLGETFRPEIGSYLRIIYNKELMENIDLRSRVEFFSNYMENPENIDVNAEVILNFKVNKWFSASLNMNLIYDDDIQIIDRFGNVGPRTQFKQVIGLGVTYTMLNYQEKKT